MSKSMNWLFRSGMITLLFLFLNAPFALSQNLSVSIPDTFAAPNAMITIPVRVIEAKGIAGAEIKVSYNPNILTALDVATTNLISGFSLKDTITTGMIAIVLANATGITGGSGDFIKLTFSVAANAEPCDTTALAFTKLSFYNEKTNPIPTISRNGLFTVKCPLGPKVYPNPFTPNNDTFNDRVRFEFSSATTSLTEVLIFNIAGRRVKRLSTANGNTIEWDGRDDDGHDLRPGVYPYIIKENGKNIRNGTVTLMR